MALLSHRSLLLRQLATRGRPRFQFGGGRSGGAGASFGFGRTRRAPVLGARFQRLTPRRGGFFKDVFKGVKKVVSVASRIPVVGALAKVAVRSVPLVGAAITAVNAVQRAVTPRTVLSAPTVTAVAAGAAPPARAPRRRRKSARRTARRTSGRRRSSAKQRAARARFARAARRGRIRKGQRL